MSLLGTLLRPRRLPPVSAIAATPCLPVDQASRVVWRGEEGRVRRRYCNDKSGGRRREGGKDGWADWRSVEQVFINSLLRASSCRRCALSTHHLAKRETRITGAQQQRRLYTTPLKPRRDFSTTNPHRQSSPTQAAVDAPDEQREHGEHLSREQYRDLAETYPPLSDLWERPLRPPSGALTKLKPPPNHLRLAPRLVLTPEQETRSPYGKETWNFLPPINKAHANQIERLKDALAHRYTDRDKAWRIYCSLPSPRPRYLRYRILRTLFHKIASVEFKDLQASQRYFALLDECLGEGVELTAVEWNTAIALAGRWVKDTSKEEVKKAVETWMRMENAGLVANHVTFNILFDVAIRAGRFALADTIYHELQAREMPLNRYFRTSMIYYAGLRADGDGVRQAFRDLVNSGQIVDTAVMNCVIRSLIRAGEAASAENVFARMKTMHATKFGTPGPRDWKGRRELGIQLNKTAERLKREKERHESSFFGGTFSADDKREEAQRAAPIHPDGRTCQILIKWHALRSGDLGRIRELLREMREGEWNVHGSVYLNIFRGFWLFGGHAYTEWNRASLEGFWEEFLEALDPSSNLSEARVDVDECQGDDVQRYTPLTTHDVEPDAAAGVQDGHDLEDGEEDGVVEDDVEDGVVEDDVEDSVEDEEGEDEISNEDRAPYFTVPLAVRVIYAFYKCAGSRKMLQVWSQIQERWPEMGDDQMAELEAVVANLVTESQ